MNTMRAIGVAILLAAGAAMQAVAQDAARARGAEFIHIGSRVFDAVRYDAADQTLTLVFSSGAAYAYRGVPRDIYLDFTRIVNKGEYFSRNIRNRFPYERLDAYPSSWAARN